MLEGKLTCIRPIRKSDLQYIQSWINDPEVQYYAQEEFPMYFEPWMVKYMYSDGIKGNRMIFMIEDKAGSVIGEVWLFPIDFKRKNAELVITIGRQELRGRGYGKDVINTIKTYCFNILKLESIYLKVFSFNTRAINCYKACGFKLIGKIPNKVTRYSVQYDEYIMEVRSAEC